MEDSQILNKIIQSIESDTKLISELNTPSTAKIDKSSNIIHKLLYLYPIYRNIPHAIQILDKYFIFCYTTIISNDTIYLIYNNLLQLCSNIKQNEYLKNICHVLHNNSAVKEQTNRWNLTLEYHFTMMYFYNFNIDNCIHLGEYYRSSFTYNSAIYTLHHFIRSNNINIYDFDFLKENKKVLPLFWLKCYLDNDLCNFEELEKNKVIINKLIQHKIYDCIQMLYLKYIGIDNELVLQLSEHITNYETNNKSKTDIVKTKNKSSKIKVGYISTNFVNHAQSSQFSSDFFTLHNETEFEIYIYSLRGNVDKQKNINVFNLQLIKDEQIIELIESHQLDIIVNSNGHADSKRPYQILSHRVAPIQIDYLGYPGTSGSTFIDYYIGDRISTNNPALFSEKILYMDNTYQLTEHINHYKEIGNTKINREECIQLLQNIDSSNIRQFLLRFNNIKITQLYNKYFDEHCFSLHKLSKLHTLESENKINNSYKNTFKECIERYNISAEQCLNDYKEMYLEYMIPVIPKDKFVLASVNGVHKIQCEDLILWKDIMMNHPNTVLLFTVYYSHEGISKIKEFFGKNFESRIYFMYNVKKIEHLNRLRYIDCVIDTTHYGAHTCCGDVIWAGVPLVTLCGEKVESRVCSSMLKAANLDELVTNSKEEYKNTIEKIIKDTNFYNIIKGKVENSRDSKLFDRKYYVNNLCELYKSTLQN